MHGAYEFTPPIHSDERGVFVSPLPQLTFTPAQLSHSRSRRGTVRGIHYTATPAGNAKYVWCTRGRALDFVIDLRSGKWDSVVLDAQEFRAVYVPPDAGHAFVALEDDTVISYLFSTAYNPAHERVVCVFDPDIALPLPPGIPVVQSERDRTAPTLAVLREQGHLPWG